LSFFFLVGYHTTTTPSSTSSSTSSTNAGGSSRVKNDYDNGSGRGNGGNDSNSNAGHQQQQSSSWSSLVKSESPHGLRGNKKNNFKNKIFSFSSDPYSSFSSQSFFPHNHRFGGGAAGKDFCFFL
jgi:hypothetical protein